MNIDMKKLILALFAIPLLSYAAIVENNVSLKTSDDKMIIVDGEKEVEIYHQEDNQGVTVTGRVGDYNYVDLGLPSGTKWATYNVGATKPTEYGDYFAWGETKPKENYSWETYKWCKCSSNSMTKYCTDSKFGTVDNKKVLDAEDDAATANWGSAWRMPSAEEIDELIDACNWKLMDNYYATGIAGRLGTSVYNGATIFLPAAGYRLGTDLYSAGFLGGCWSSSLRENYSRRASCLNFYDCRISRFNGRSLGQSIRAVLR